MKGHNGGTILQQLQSLEVTSEWEDVQEWSQDSKQKEALGGPLSHSVHLSESSKPDSTSSSSSAPKQPRNLAKALQRYNSVKAVAEANQARLPQRFSAPSRSVYQSAPAEFTSSEVGVLGAKVAQLNSVPDVWFSDFNNQNVKATSTSPKPAYGRQEHGEAHSILDRWDHHAAGLLDSAEGQYSQHDFTSSPSSKRQETHDRGFGQRSPDYLQQPDNIRQRYIPRWEIGNLRDEDEELQRRIEHANTVELQSSYAYKADYSWPRTVTDTLPAEPVTSFQEDFSPLQRSTMQLQARYWPKGLQQFTSFKIQQNAQRSPEPKSCKQWTETQEPLRESATSAEPMLETRDSGDVHRESCMRDSRKKSKLWSKFCACSKKQLSPMKPKGPAPGNAASHSASTRQESHTSKLIKALRSKKVHVWDLVDANTAENTVRNFQTMSNAPIIPDDFGPEGPLQEFAPYKDFDDIDEPLSSPTIPAYVAGRPDFDLEEDGWVTNRYADMLNANRGPACEVRRSTEHKAWAELY